MNRFVAKVLDIQSKEGMNLVSFRFFSSKLTMVSLDLNENIKVGKDVLLSIKATNITLAKNFEGLLSFANKFTGKIVLIEQGEIISCISCDIGELVIEVIITTNSLKRMDLNLNEEVNLLFKATDLAILEVIDD